MRTDAGALASIGAADLDLIIRDDTAATDTVVDDDIPLTGPAADGWRVRRPSVPASALTPGHDLRIVVRLRIAAAPVGTDPGGTDPSPTDPAPDGIGDVLVDGRPAGPSDAAPAPRPLTPAAPTLSAMLRACYGGDLALTHIQREGRRVRLRGVSALPAGTRIALRDDRGRPVGTAKVGRDGRFAATAPPLRPRGAREPRTPRLRGASGRGPCAYRLGVTVPAGAGRAVVRAAVRGKIRSPSLFGLA